MAPMERGYPAMGQYFVVANLDSGEYLSPSSLNSGAKAREQVGHWIGVPHALMLLLGTGMGRGGGDFGVSNDSSALDAINAGDIEGAQRLVAEGQQLIADDPVLGRWAGQRVCFVGDYYEPGDVPGVDDPNLYQTIMRTFTDIGPMVAPYLDVNFPSNGS